MDLDFVGQAHRPCPHHISTIVRSDGALEHGVGSMADIGGFPGYAGVLPDRG